MPPEAAFGLSDMNKKQGATQKVAPCLLMI